MNSIGLLAAGDAGGGASNPILPVWNEIIWGGMAFAILFIVMAKFAYPAIKKAMEEFLRLLELKPNRSDKSDSLR